MSHTSLKLRNVIICASLKDGCLKCENTSYCKRNDTQRFGLVSKRNANIVIELSDAGGGRNATGRERMFGILINCKKNKLKLLYIFFCNIFVYILNDLISCSSLLT